MSLSNPGKISASDPIIKKIDFGPDNSKYRNLWTPQAKENTPSNAVRIAIEISNKLPFPINSSSKTNIKGIKNATIANLTPTNPTSVGLAFAIPAAVYEARATGGVITAIQEK